MEQELLPTNLTNAELSNSIPQKELAKFRGEHTSLGQAFINRQIAQAENDPFMWVVDMPYETSASYVRVKHVPAMIRAKRSRMPNADELDERHPRDGGGRFKDGRKPDPNANPAIKQAMAVAERQEQKLKDAQKKDTDYVDLAQRLESLSERLDTTLGKILTAMTSEPAVEPVQPLSEPPAPEPIPMRQWFRCKQCDFEAKSRGGLTRHVRMQHRGD